MPGGGKGGSSPSGNTTTTTINPTQQAQLPFLTGAAVQNSAFPNSAVGWNQALNLAAGDPLQYFPGQSLADFNPGLFTGYNSMIGGMGPVGNNIVSPANAEFNAAVNGSQGIGNSPAYNTYTSLAGAGTQPQLDLHNLASALGTGVASQAGSIAGGGLPQDQNAFQQIGWLENLGGQATSNPFIGALQNYAQSPVRADTFDSNLGNLGYGITTDTNGYNPNISPITGYGNAAASYGSGAVNSNPATSLLLSTARGDFLNKNPYIAGQYDAASRPMVNAYQTATAPQTDSNFEAAGRYGSGVLGSARSINEQNLGKSLGDLSANLYGQDYANERGLMTNAQGTLGSLINQGYGLGIQGASTAGQLQNAAASQTLGEQSLGLNALSNAGNLDANLYSTRAGMLSNAGNLYNSGVSNAIGANSNAANIDLGMIDRMLSGVGAQNNALTSAGQLTNASLQGVLGGASGLQSGYDTGNRNALIGLGMLPQVTQANYTPAQMAIQGGQGLTGINQAQINDAMSRFYGNQQAPWQTESQYMNLVGQPTSGSSSTQQPFFTNPLANALGAATGGLGLVNGLGSAFGSGGLFGGGGGAFGLSNSALGSIGGTALNGGGLADAGLAGGFFGPAVDATAGGSALGSGLLGAFAWIVCTELMRQGRMPKRYWISGSKVFAAYPEAVKRGYYLWAIPSVRHLRNRPDSLYSRLLERAFNWRAQDIAAKAGIKGARKLRRGAAVTAVLYPVCFALGSVCRERNWRSVYRPAAK